MGEGEVVESKGGGNSATIIPHETLLKELDLSRRTIEALDRSMMTARQLYYVVIGLLFGALSLSIGKIDTIFFILALQGISVVVMSFSLTFWLLDRHYHRYLKSAVNSCTNIEKELKLDTKPGLALNIGLEETREKSQEGKIIPLMLYVFPTVIFMSLSLLVMIYFNINGTNITYYTGLAILMVEAQILQYWARKITSFLEEEPSEENAT